MNKSLYYENKIYKKFSLLTKKYNCVVQLVNNIPANGCVINFDNKYIIFISDKLDKKLLPLVLFHEIGHIHFKTFRHDPKKYNYFIELLSNLYAITKLKFIFPLHKRFSLFFLAFYKEKKLYNYYKNNTLVGGKIIYEKISKDK